MPYEDIEDEPAAEDELPPPVDAAAPVVDAQPPVLPVNQVCQSSWLAGAWESTSRSHCGGRLSRCHYIQLGPLPPLQRSTALPLSTDRGGAGGAPAADASTGARRGAAADAVAS